MDERSDPGVRFDHTSTGAMSIVAPHGELDLRTTGPLRAAVDAALHDRPLILAVDLRGVSFMDGGTADELVAIGRRCRAEGRRFMLIRGGTQVDRVLAALDLENHLELIAGPEEIPSARAT